MNCNCFLKLSLLAIFFFLPLNAFALDEQELILDRGQVSQEWPDRNNTEIEPILEHGSSENAPMVEEAILETEDDYVEPDLIRGNETAETNLKEVSNNFGEALTLIGQSIKKASPDPKKTSDNFGEALKGTGDQISKVAVGVGTLQHKQITTTKAIEGGEIIIEESVPKEEIAAE